MDQITRVFIDTSKSFFQLHGVNAAEEPVLRRKLTRGQLLGFFGKMSPTVVGLEACGASHHWARELQALGHEVKLVPAQYVKPYVKRGKNDARDAEAGCEAMSRPTMRFVPVKSCEQQAALMLVQVRESLVRQRTRLANSIRGHAAEFGLVAAKGRDGVAELLRAVLEPHAVPRAAQIAFAALAGEWDRLAELIRPLEAELLAWHRREETSRRLAQIPSVGPVGAALLVLKTPDPAGFASARHFAAWIGLTPKDHSTANRQRLGCITRAGDEALRSALVVGATSLLKQVRNGKGPRSPWLLKLLAHKEPKEAAVALANKVARIAWRMMLSGQDYDPSGLLRELPA